MRALVTGGAGFIGSHLTEALLARGHEVVVLDDLSTGFADNVPDEATFVHASITDAPAVAAAVDGCDVVFHQAAHRAVLRSVEHPIETDRANTAGTLVVLEAARDAGARRVVAASSSSVYGGAEQLPTPESAPLTPRSPYAVSKLAGEHYARVFWELYGLETVALRYFNVFGPRQRPDSQYAAVIPLFVAAALDGASPQVHGDGLQSRSFVYVTDTVAANLAAAEAPAERCAGRAFNIAGSRRSTLLDLLDALREITGEALTPEHIEPRPGDVRHSHADVSAAAAALGWEPTTDLVSGLRSTVEWLSSSAADFTTLATRRGTGR